MAQLENELLANPLGSAEISVKIREMNRAFKADVAKAIEQDRAAGRIDESKADEMCKEFGIEHLKPSPTSSRALSDFLQKYSIAITNRLTFGNFIEKNNGANVSFSEQEKPVRFRLAYLSWFVLFPLDKGYFVFLDPTVSKEIAGESARPLYRMFLILLRTIYGLLPQNRWR